MASAPPRPDQPAPVDEPDEIPPLPGEPPPPLNPDPVAGG